ncbi:MAG: tetratricopeptide repeat protein [Bacteroidota bacterium]|jgi:Ca-activated chloride channel family protein
MKFLIYILIALNLIIVSAQEEKNLLVDGNKAYNGSEFKKAEEKYKKSLEVKKNYTKANFNLGNAMYKNQKFEDAASQFDVAISNTNNKDTLSKIYHNLGNSYLKSKKYQEAVNAYKNSLKLNSYDDETRYNLAYAMKKLQEQQKQNQKNNQDKQNQQDQKNKKDQKDNQQPKEEQSKISKEQAEQMIKALIQNEKKLQDQKKQKDKNARKAEVEKDW